MRKTLSRLVLGGAALLLISWTLPATTFALASLGLVLMLSVVLRRRRLLTLAPI
jgi:hypothetical protein